MPMTKVCQNHPLELPGSTRFAKNHAYIASKRCAAIVRIDTILSTNIDRKMKRRIALMRDKGAMAGNHATANTAIIAVTTKNQVYIVGPSRVFLFLSCQYEMVAAIPSRGLTMGT
ncbi:hypothetical protein SLEP1_g41896 [Rubroshorea leprosula]|uniref:Uncharacterized protein n=1 Tax=Rubroshorea leprosula TaxID=152421 RepID=A0AAV5L8B3_9ROSI|nr:hypothetical protein SLEP1_g41896 [Rubroshorea leprosula]